MAAMGLRAYRLGYPDKPYFDEIYYVGGARDYLAGRADDNSVHPPLAKMVIADAMSVGGDSPDMWRLPSLLSGAGTLVLTWGLAWVLTGRARLAALAMLLLSLDFLHLVQSRIAMLDGIQSFWIMGGMVAAARTARRERAGWWTEVMGGLCFGCATACKWNGLFAATGAFVALIWMGLGWRRLVRVAVTYGLCITLVYLISYFPLFAREGLDLRILAAQHRRMLDFRYDPKQFHHRYLSYFYSWPLVLRPVWYHFVEAAGRVRGVVAMGCPLFWWFALLLLGESLVSASRRAQPTVRFLVPGILAQWLLWAAGTTGGFLYYMLPVTPLMAVLVARELDDWWEEPLSRGLAIAYLVVLTIVLAVFYPLLTAISIPRPYFNVLFFLPGWT